MSRVSTHLGLCLLRVGEGALRPAEAVCLPPPAAAPPPPSQLIGLLRTIRLLRSADAYRVTEESTVVLAAPVSPLIKLDDKHYK